VECVESERQKGFPELLDAGFRKKPTRENAERQMRTNALPGLRSGEEWKLRQRGLLHSK